MIKFAVCLLKALFNNEKTLSTDTDDGWTTNILLVAVAHSGKLDLEESNQIDMVHRW